MSQIVNDWRCGSCGGRVRKTEAKKMARHLFIYCNYSPCINSPAKGGGELMLDHNFSRGFRPNWVEKTSA